MIIYLLLIESVTILINLNCIWIRLISRSLLQHYRSIHFRIKDRDHYTSAHLTPRAAAKAQDSREDLEQIQEVFVFIIKALPKHQ